MQNLTCHLSGLELSIAGSKGQERLQILGDYPTTPEAQLLFSNLGLMHLVSPYFPERITTNFGVAPEMRELIVFIYVHMLQYFHMVRK